MMPVVCVIYLCSSGALKADTKASTHTTVSSVQMLAVHLQFGVRSDVKMLPSFLRCFPSVEMLIVEVATPHFAHSLAFGSSSLYCIGLLLHCDHYVQLNCSLISIAVSGTS